MSGDWNLKFYRWDVRFYETMYKTSDFLMKNQFFKKDDSKWPVIEEVGNFTGVQSKLPCNWLSR